MTEDEARRALHHALAEVGVGVADTLYLGVDIGRVPLPRYPAALNQDAIRCRQERWCGFLLDCLLDLLGPDGTVLAPAFTYRCSDPGHPFVLEETPSEVGAFTEYLRRRPSAHRSLHPIFSVTGVGRNAGAILRDTGRSAFGPLSPFGRLNTHEAKLLSLGIRFRDSMTYIHHLEQSYGCNHRYHKQFQTPVYQGGRKVEGPWLAYVRYRGVASKVDLAGLEERLLGAGVMKATTLDGHPIQCVRTVDVDRVGYPMLVENPCAFADRRFAVHYDESEVGTSPSPDEEIWFKLSF